MYQTEPILFLQSFSNELLDVFFIFVTRLGDREIVQFLLITVIFGIDFRKGFILLHMVIWTAFATDLFKNFFALPRPYQVDSAVRVIGRNITNPTPLKDMGANRFWGLPDHAAIEYVRLKYVFDRLQMRVPRSHPALFQAVWPVCFMACFVWMAIEINILLGLMKRE